MSLSRTQIAMGVKIKLGILAVLKDCPDGLDKKTIIPRVRKTVTGATDYQVSHMLRNMTDCYLSVDRTHPRHFIYSLSAGESVAMPEADEDDGVIQRTVPASAFPCIPVFIQRNPMQWCVDVLAGAA